MERGSVNQRVPSKIGALSECQKRNKLSTIEEHTIWKNGDTYEQKRIWFQAECTYQLCDKYVTR